MVPFSGIVAAPNALAMVGGLMTVMFAEEVLPLPASVERICDAVGVVVVDGSGDVHGNRANPNRREVIAEADAAASSHRRNRAAAGIGHVRELPPPAIQPAAYR